MPPFPIGTHLGAGLFLLLLGGCGTGGSGSGGSGASGGGGTPAVSFSFTSSAATLAESDGPASIQVVLHTSVPVLEAEATVEVVDTGSGTASPATDYTALPAQTIRFLAGAHDGDTSAVTLDPLDDSLVEGASETVLLALRNPSIGKLDGPTQFTVTLTDIHSAVIGFATTRSTTPDESSGARTIALELDCGPGVTLGVPVSVLVSDLRTGSASSGGDYSPFTPETVRFSAGNADGAVQTVHVQVVDDGALEGDETVLLGLSAPSAACTIGANGTHELAIHDDDLVAGTDFLASEGSSGIENPLVHDELVMLGSQIVGAGPNAGTLVRVASGGTTPLHLGTPRLVGSHPNDFALEIESTSAPLAAPATGTSPGPVFHPVHRDEIGPGLALRLDGAEIAHLGSLEQAELHGFPLPDLGPVTIELERRPLPLTAGAKLAIDGQEIAGGVRALVGDLQVWRGAVAGMPGSRVFLALSGTSAHGFFELPSLPDRFVHVLTDASGQVHLVRDEELAAFAPLPQEFCAGERLVSSQQRIRKLGDTGTPGTSALTVSDCTLAIETDHQLFEKFGSSTGLTNYVTGLIGAVSDQYLTDVQTTISIAYLGIHTTSDDGWITQEASGVGSSDLLDEFQTKWGTSWPVQADLAHFLSGAMLGGGVANVDVLCSPVSGFAVSANLSGTIDWSGWTGQPASFTWDFVVVAHELGHNFGSLHTHDADQYCPPLDRCFTNCTGSSVCSRGTLMSYCHLCPGGVANIDLHFHPVTAEIMRERVLASCLDDALLTGGDFVQYRVRFDPLTATGERSAAIEFTHDAANAPQPFRVRLSGTAK